MTKKTLTDNAPDAKQGSCNVPGCVFDAETRGLCDAHWSTHRGLADPEPVKIEPDPGVTK